MREGIIALNPESILKQEADYLDQISTLQQRLIVSERRVDLLEGLLKSGSSPTYAHCSAVMEALKPAEEGGRVVSREIRSKRRDVERARTEFVRAATKDYDSKVFYPALEAIKNECGKIGHGSQYSHNNGLGWIFMHCSSCGAMLEKIGTDGERIKP